MKSEVRAQSSEGAGSSVPDSRFPTPDSAESRVTSHDLTLEELRAWGESFGRHLRAPVIVALEGELGAGKTTLVQAICRGVGIAGEVTSPTFALVNEYQGNGATVYHLDLYRLNAAGDLTNLGWDDIINSGEIVLIEWPDRAGNRVPPDAIRIRLEYVPADDDRRRLTVG